MNKEVAIELRRRLQIKGALRFDDITKPLQLTVKEVDSDGFDGALVRRSSTFVLQGQRLGKRDRSLKDRSAALYGAGRHKLGVP